MLLQSASDRLRDAQAAVNADVFSFEVTPKSVMAKAFDVPEDCVALYSVQLQLSKPEACMSPAQRQRAIRETFIDCLSSPASTLHAVQVMSMTVDMGGEACAGGRRSLRALLETYSAATATVEMMLVSEACVQPAGVCADARRDQRGARRAELAEGAHRRRLQVRRTRQLWSQRLGRP
eukprot:3572657-Rhodomonas_salina.7